MIRPIASFAATAALCACALACEQPGQTERQKETKAAEQAMSARTEAEQNAQNAQAAADKQIAAARTDFAKAREDYLHGRRQDLIKLDGEVFDLESKARTAKNAKTKADLDACLPAIRAQREAFVRHMQALERESAATWDAARASLEKEWDTLRDAVNKAD
jgi:hypothetical protein